MPLTFAAAGTPALPLIALYADEVAARLDALPDAQAAWLRAAGFKGGLGEVALLPGEGGALAGAVAGLGNRAQAARHRFALAGARAKLPDAVFELDSSLAGDALDEAALGWLLAGYRFDRYAAQSAPKAQLVAPAGIDATRIEAIAAGEALTRDLINTPAADMGPAELAAAAQQVADRFGASFAVTIGDDLLAKNFPMIHTVGRAATRAPRLIDMSWGSTGPKLTLVGKGVCFDTGGLDIKPPSSMGLMKKDMGGAATVLGLAQMIMALNVPVQLRVLIPAVENAIAGDAFRPQDILTSRKGLTVEVNNTDAEGRLVLADALALADESDPDMIISMATLTGAARVAVGPDLAPFYVTQQGDAATLMAAGATVADPLWQLPFWEPYEAMIEPGIADLDNAPSGGMAGSITAALFLRRFVTDCPKYAHFDIYGWVPADKPARPKGGAGQAARAILAALPGLLDL